MIRFEKANTGDAKVLALVSERAFDNDIWDSPREDDQRIGRLVNLELEYSL